MFDTTFVSMDISTSQVRVTCARGRKVREWGSAPIPVGAVKDGIIKNPAAVGAAISTLFRSMRLPKRHVIATVTGLPFVYRVITMPRLGGEASAEALERAARREMSVEDMHLSWQMLQTESTGSEASYFVLGVPEAATRPLLETLAEAGIKPYILGVKPLALARMVYSGDALLACLEKDYVDVVIVTNGLMRVMHGFAVSKAENAEGIVSEFADGLSKAVSSYNRDHPKNVISGDTPLYLTGELSADADVVRLVQQVSEHPVHVVESPLAAPEQMPLSVYAANVGLILKKIPARTRRPGPSAYSDINLNLLAVRRRPIKWGYAVSGLLIVVLGAALYGAYGLRTAAAARADAVRPESMRVLRQVTEAQKVNKELATTTKEKTDSLKKLQDALNTMKGEQESIFQLKYDYSSRFGLIVGALPEGARFTAITMTKDHTAEIKGEAKSALDVVGFTEALEQNSVFRATRVSRIEPMKDVTTVSFTATIGG